MDDGGASMETQFEEFRALLDDSGSVRERIRSVVSEIESVVRVMQSNLLLVHHALVSPEVLEKAKVQISTLQSLFKQLSDVTSERPGQYYRYHGDWRGETQSVVSSLAFLHWLETENLLTHAEAEEKLGLDPSQFCLDIEDYLIGSPIKATKQFKDSETHYMKAVDGISSVTTIYNKENVSPMAAVFEGV